MSPEHDENGAFGGNLHAASNGVFDNLDQLALTVK
jgi:hypothetical protein